MAQIARLKDAEIADGNLIYAADLEDELNSLVSESNSQDTRLTSLESGNYTQSGNVTLSNALKVNQIDERTAASGVTIDSVLLKDGMATVAGTPASNGQIGYVSNQFKGYRNGSALNFLMAGDVGGPITATSDITADPTPGLAAAGTHYSCSGTFTVTFAAVATLADLWRASFSNDGTGVVILDGNGAETFQWGPATPTTIALQPGESCTIICDGAELKVLSFTPRFISSAQTITAGGSLTLAHGLGAQPWNIGNPVLVCTTGEGGYSIGDELVYFSEGGAGTNRGFVSIVPDATNLNVRFASSTPQIPRKDTGAQFDLTAGSWNVVFRAWL